MRMRNDWVEKEEEEKEEKEVQGDRKGSGDHDLPRDIGGQNITSLRSHLHPYPYLTPNPTSKIHPPKPIFIPSVMVNLSRDASCKVECVDLRSWGKSRDEEGAFSLLYIRVDD